MFSSLSILLVLISIILEQVAGAGLFNDNNLQPTSCKNYDHVQSAWSNFPLCFVQRIQVPFGTTATPYTCAYWQAYTLIDLNNVSLVQSLFPNRNLLGLDSSNLGLQFLTFKNLQNSDVLQTSAWQTLALGEVTTLENSTNLIKNDVIVYNSSIGHVRIVCPIGTLKELSKATCSLVSETYVCTYKRNATDSDIQTLILGAVALGVNMQSLGTVNQTGCSNPIYQKSPIPLPQLPLL